MEGFKEDSSNGLLARTVKLEERVEYLEASLTAMQEAFQSIINDRTQLKGGLFSKKDEVEVLTVQVARDGNRVMYTFDKDDPNIHHDVPCDRFLGRFKKIELQEGTVKGKPITYVVAHMENGNQLVRLRLGNVGKPSGALKSFLDNLSRVPDEWMTKDVIFWPYPGTDDSVTLVSILNPETEKSFPYPEREKADWNDDAYWQDLLTKTIARIESFNVGSVHSSTNSTSIPVINTETKPPVAKKVIDKPKLNQPEQRDRTGEPISFTGSISLLISEQLQQWEDEEDDRITRSCLRINVRRESDGKDVPCLLLDGLAVKVAQLYRPGQRVSCSGVRDRDEDGKSIVLAEIIEPASSDDTSDDPSSLITLTDIEMERLGWTKQHGRDYLKRTYQKASRKALKPAQLEEFLEHLRSLPSPAMHA